MITHTKTIRVPFTFMNFAYTLFKVICYISDDRSLSTTLTKTGIIQNMNTVTKTFFSKLVFYLWNSKFILLHSSIILRVSEL